MQNKELLVKLQGRRKVLEIGGVNSGGSLVVLQRVGAFDEHL